jgi:2-polyprenyl-3-methyl-5-hydroxy-6-metoxy-1,4-benzoquinol methylase
LSEKFPKHKTILDVGASRGTFVRIAANYGFSVTALEPDSALADAMKQKGFEVINGFFPHADGLTDKKFNVIIFNDSFEHIPNPSSVIEGVKKHLTPDGIAVINLPSSDGFLFRCSLILAKIGIMAPLYRLWQKDTASPHLHYFNPRNLRRLFESSGFNQELSHPVPYYTLSGLWKRISCASPLPVAIPSWAALVSLYPLCRLKNDAFVSFFRKLI